MKNCCIFPEFNGINIHQRLNNANMKMKKKKGKRKTKKLSGEFGHVHRAPMRFSRARRCRSYLAVYLTHQGTRALLYVVSCERGEPMRFETAVKCRFVLASRKLGEDISGRDKTAR